MSITSEHLRMRLAQIRPLVPRPLPVRLSEKNLAQLERDPDVDVRHLDDDQHAVAYIPAGRDTNGYNYDSAAILVSREPNLDLEQYDG